MTRKQFLSIFLVSVTAVLLTSCTDQRLSKEIEGTWKGSMVIANDDQSREQQTIYDKYDYVGKGNEGKLTEVIVSNIKDIDLDEATMDVGYQSYIEGTWKIDDGQLYTSYDVTTLKVKVDENKVKVRWNSFLGVLSDMYEKYGGLIFGNSTQKEIVDEIQKKIYKTMFHQYQDDESDEASYPELTIENGNMSYKTSDAGTVHFKKVKTNINKVFNGYEDDDDVEVKSAASSTSTTTTSDTGGSKTTDKDRDDIIDLIEAWDELHVGITMEQVNDVYAPTVSFYGMNLNRSQVFSKISSLITNTPDFSQNSHDFTFTEQPNGDVMVEFTKSTVANGRSHDYPGYLVVKRSSNDYGWSVLKESDKVTDRNLQK